MPRLTGEYHIFDNFIYELFRAYDIPFQAGVALARGLKVDLILTLPSGRRVVVENKLYGSTVAETVPIRQALAQLRSLMQQSGSSGALLIVSTRLATYQRKQNRSRLEGALIFDLTDLFYWFLVNDDLFEEYYSFMLAIAFDNELSRSEIRKSAEDAKQKALTQPPIRQLLLDILDDCTETLIVGESPDLKNGKGAKLCLALRDLDPGRPDASAFEHLATDVINYLFGRNLSRIEPQNILDNGLRIDLCAKILPKDFFWQNLVRDFNCRYIVFEFKNYKSKISQEQVYSTEKYLLRDALRTIAIVFSQQGPDKGAKIASKGALREAGKVIIHLDLNDVCKMLEEKDGGGTPEKLLEERFDEMLMTLAR